MSDLLEDAIIVYHLKSPPRETPMNATKELLETLAYQTPGDARAKLETMRRSGEVLRYIIEEGGSIKITLPDLTEMTIGQI